MKKYVVFVLMLLSIPSLASENSIRQQVGNLHQMLGAYAHRDESNTFTQVDLLAGDTAPIALVMPSQYRFDVVVQKVSYDGQSSMNAYVCDIDNESLESFLKTSEAQSGEVVAALGCLNRKKFNSPDQSEDHLVVVKTGENSAAFFFQTSKYTRQVGGHDLEKIEAYSLKD